MFSILLMRHVLLETNNTVHLQIGLENHVMSIQLIRPLKIRSPADAHIECSAKLVLYKLY